MATTTVTVDVKPIVDRWLALGVVLFTVGLILGAFVLGHVLTKPTQADCHTVQLSDQGLTCQTSDGTQLDLVIR